MESLKIVARRHTDDVSSSPHKPRFMPRSLRNRLKLQERICKRLCLDSATSAGMRKITRGRRRRLIDEHIRDEQGDYGSRRGIEQVREDVH